MGILLNLTKEYFGDKFRAEDKDTVSNFLKKCIERKKINTFISEFKDWNNENYLVYNGNTNVSEAKVMSESEARVKIIEQTDRNDFGWIALSKQILNANLNFYRKNTKNYDKMTEDVKREIDRVFRLSVKYPEFISTYLLLDVNSVSYLDRKSPCEISIMEASDVLTATKYKECVLIHIPKGMTISLYMGKFNTIVSMIWDNLMTSFENNGYKNYIGTTSVNVCPYDNTYTRLYVK
jgi:hypothetical protein